MSEIGSTLREARMRARIDISEVEARTKIRAKYLRAIENEEWDLLPGQVYVKSFLRTYGDFLGLDSRMLIDDFKRRYERPSDPETRPIAALGRERERAARGPLLPPWALIGLVLAVLVVTLYVVGRNASKTTTPPTGVGTKGIHRATRRASAAQPRAAAPQAATLELVPTGQIYVCVVDGSGKKLIPGRLFSAASSIPTQTAAKLLVTLGNNSVRMKVDGKLVKIAPSSSSIGFLVGPSGYRSLPRSKQPTCA